MDSPAPPPDEARVDVRASFILWVYPFVFRPETYEARVARLFAPDSRFATNKPAIYDDTLLPHVSRFLTRDPADIGSVSLFLAKPGKSAEMLLFGEASQQLSWHLIAAGKSAMPFRFAGAVQLALFEGGTGFCAVSAFPTGDAAGDWSDFLHYFRYADGRGKETRVRATRPNGTEAVCQPVLTGIERLLREEIALTRRAGQTPTLAADEFSDIFVPGRLLPYAALYVDGMPADERGTFLFRTRHFFDSARFLLPATDETRADHPAHWQYVKDGYVVQTQGGGVFVLFDAPYARRGPATFFRGNLPHLFQETYFVLYLLVLSQRFVLLTLSERVAWYWKAAPTLAERAALFAEIRDRLFLFRARGHFRQAAHQIGNQMAYHRWQDVLEIDSLYDEVEREVDDMEAYLREIREKEDAAIEARQHAEEIAADKAILTASQAQADRAADQTLRLTQLATVATIVGISIAFLQVLQAVNPRRFTNGYTVLLWMLGASLVAFVVVWVLERRRAGRR